MQRNKRTIEQVVKARTLTLGVGVLAILEEEMGYLWGENKNEEELTEQEKQLDQLYERVRTKILDHTHIQKNRLIKEIKGFYDEGK